MVLLKFNTIKDCLTRLLEIIACSWRNEQSYINLFALLANESTFGIKDLL